MEGKGATRVVGYGHVGDGNMHLNITTPQYSQEVMDGIEPFLYEWTSSHRSGIFRGFHLRNTHAYFFLVSLKFQIQGQHICRAWPWIQEEKLYPLLKIGLGNFSDEADQAGEKCKKRNRSNLKMLLCRCLILKES